MLAGAICLLLAACGRGTDPLGKRIFEDGVGMEGRIHYTQGPDWLRFAGPGCAVCHGVRGAGLSVQAGDVTGVAPPITWDALIERGYDERSLRTALRDGVDPHGREFQYYMPRWTLSDAELDALTAYLQQL